VCPARSILEILNGRGTNSEEILETHKITQNIGPAEQPGAIRQLPSGHILVERYSIQEVIGIGGMGSVYRARDLHFPNVVKLVAVKEMINQAPDPLVRKTIVQNFEREANILVTLSHPSIPKIYDYFTYDDRSYLVIEYVNGKDLQALLNSTTEFFTEEQVIGWAIELCDVLCYLHDHKPEPIIFRDVKPSNIMVNQQSHIMLVDFGIAKIFKAGQKGTMIGTEGYSPPEQYRGEASPMADIYALGATVHHLLTRRDPQLEPPFTFAERPIRKSNPNISPELEAVISTALQYNPSERYQTAAAFKDALLSAAKRTGSLQRISYSATLKENDESIKPLWTFKCEDEIRSSISYDSGMLFCGTYDNNLYALNATDGSFAWKFPTDGGIVTKPAIMDGTVYFGSEDQNLYAVSARSGKVQWTYNTQGPIRSSPFLAEGHVFFGSDDGFLYAVNLMSNRMTWRVDMGGPVRSSPFVTNDFVYSGCETGELFCTDFRGAIKWRFRAKRAITSSPQVYQTFVYFASLDTMVYALDAKSGWVVWKFRMGKGSVSTPFRHENNLYIGSADNHIYCLDASNSKEIWRYKTNHQVSGSPVVYKDAVYCGSADGNMYCIEQKTGRLRWRFTTEGPITGIPMIVDNVLYFGSSDHLIYAIMV